MKNPIQDAAVKISQEMKSWIDKEVDALVPRWLQILAMKDKTGIVKKLIGIQLEWSSNQSETFKDLSPLTQTIKIYKHKKLLRVGNFTIKFKKDKK